MSGRLRGVRAAAATVLAAAVTAATAAGATAQEADPDSLRSEIEALARRLEAVELALAEQRALLERQLQAAMEAEAAGGGEAGVRAPFSFSGEVWSDPRQRQTSGIYGRPFVARSGRGTALGGYVDLEFERDLESGETTFDQHRFIPFIFAQITDRIHFATELEFEHGAEEIKLEFASLDVTFHDWLNFRGGIVLSPVGKFNLVHDSPVNDLTLRPLVSRQIIPTTLSEAGVGVFGTLYPSEMSVLTYEAYVVNGFDEGILTGGVSGLPSIRSGRGSLETDNNAAKSIAARVGYSPFLGLEVGASVHTGGYAPDDEATRTGLGLTGGEGLTIMALDGVFTRGPFEVLGEFAQASIDAPAGFATGQRGYYVQGNYHFGHGLVPFFESSIFTGVLRWGRLDRDIDVDGAMRNRLTVGLNWRPVEETVFKFDMANDWLIDAGATEAGPVSRTFFFSIASYF